MEYKFNEKKHVVKDSLLGAFIRHPLYVGLYFDVLPSSDGGFTTIEEVIERKINYIPDKDTEPLKWIFFHERPYRLDAMLEVQYDGHIARQVYMDSEFPQGQTWKLIFDLFEPQELMGEEDLKVYNELPEEFEIFQGDTGDPYEVSWTLDKDIATWFANRFDGSGVVRSKVVSKQSIRAYFGGRNEKEIIYW